MSASPLPIALSQLLEALGARGFEVTQRQYSEESFGNQLIELSPTESSVVTGIRLVRERGLWGVEIQLDDGHWFDPYSVCQALENASYSARALNHVERRDLTIDAIDRLPTDRAGLHKLYERLLDYQREYAKQFTAELE